jgi:hypothetical protein
MSAKAEISWKRKTDEGEKIEVYARHVGKNWVFFHRTKRFENWEPLEVPPLEDWLELLDSVKRRVNRRLQRPEAEHQLKREILERFPEAELD